MSDESENSENPFDLSALFARDVEIVTTTSIGQESIGSKFISHSASEVAVWATPFTDDESKVKILKFLRAEFKRRKVIAYSHVAECWYLSQDSAAIKLIEQFLEGETAARKIPKILHDRLKRELIYNLPPPSQHPDRQEGITIGAYNATHGVQCVLPILRDSNGLISGLGESTLPPIEGPIGESVAGRMVAGRMASLLCDDQEEDED